MENHQQLYRILEDLYNKYNENEMNNIINIINKELYFSDSFYKYMNNYLDNALFKDKLNKILNIFLSY